MDYSWRTSLTKYIEDNYIQKQEEWFDFDLSPSGLLNMTIVSERFASQPLEQRREQIRSMIHEIQAPPTTGFLALYTPEEAESIGLSRPSHTEENPVYTWLELAQRAANPSENQQPSIRAPRIPRTITFYSFKGGVGRTTALTHVAAILATRGRKVVAVDLDLEAPGLSSALSLTPSPQYGIVDYFYERAYLPEGVEPSISVTEIFGEVRIPDAPGRLFVVPAGKLSLDYIAKVDDLRANVVTENGEDLWSIFYREITDQLQPDIILIDSRTGINEWGAFSLLRAADKAIVFLYPNEQNKQGIDLLLEALVGNVSIQLVFSPVPLPLIREAQMQKIRNMQAEYQEKYKIGMGEPIAIPYLTEIATSDIYPLPTLYSLYVPIANVTDEEMHSIHLRNKLSNREYRQEILESLQFNMLEAAKEGSIYHLFQRTADFDKFIDPATCLIRGRKGTGKSTLYWLFLKHRSYALDLTFGRGSKALYFSGHGPIQPGPTADEFRRIDNLLLSHNCTWEAFWQAYLLFRLHTDERYNSEMPVSELTQLHSLFPNIPTSLLEWKQKYSKAVIGVASEPRLASQGNTVLRNYNKRLGANNESFWFFYDHLDEDFYEEVRGKALSGLFSLVQKCYTRLKQFRFKIFLQEDIWNSLVLDNKTFFNGRDISLQWTKTDCLRLTLRQTSLSSMFKDALNELSPIENIDQANEDTLDEALQLLWGNRLEPYSPSPRVSEWIYYKLCDGSITILPNSLISTLREATRLEIQNAVNQPDDRLLSAMTLNGGLIEASRERCSEMREAFPALQPFFDALSGKYPMIPTSDMQSLWQQTVEGHVVYERDFEAFIAFLRDIGLLERSTLIKDNQVIYTVASLYVDGFNMKAIDSLSV